MNKEEARKIFIKLRLKQLKFKKCKDILENKYKYLVSIRTLNRWQQRFEKEEIWDFKDKSTIPNKIYFKVTLEAKKQIVLLREKTGWGAKKLHQHLKHLDISIITINRVLKQEGLTRKEHIRGQRAKYVRFEREHANSLWHIDDSEFGEKGKVIAVVDDATRYCIGLLNSPTVTTPIVTEFLDSLFKTHGIPTQIISDNGAPYGLKSKYSKFDIWCRRRKIEHIRTRVKRPQTNGKVERLFGTIDREIKYCNNDLELFRMRYNHLRPHESLNSKTPANEYDSFERLIK